MSAPLALFDIDGTLCDTFNVDDECFCAAASAALDIPVLISSWEQATHITDLGIANWLWSYHLHRLPTENEVKALADAYELKLLRELRRSPERFTVVPGALDLLNHLLAADWDVAIATGGWSRLARLKLSAAGIPTRLLLASSDDSQDRFKIFRLASDRAAKRRRDSHSRIVLVGDGAWDLRVAAEHGWCFLGVGKAERRSRLLAEGAFAVTEDFSNLPRVFDLLQQCRPPAVRKISRTD